jgi:hypothetical protein
MKKLLLISAMFLGCSDKKVDPYQIILNDYSSDSVITRKHIEEFRKTLCDITSENNSRSIVARIYYPETFQKLAKLNYKISSLNYQNLYEISW